MKNALKFLKDRAEAEDLRQWREEAADYERRQLTARGLKPLPSPAKRLALSAADASDPLAVAFAEAQALQSRRFAMLDAVNEMMKS